MDAIECSYKYDVRLKNISCTKLLSESGCFAHQRKLELFCRQCGVEICTDCVSTSHRGHNYTTPSDMIDDETWQLEEAGDGLVDLFKDVKRTVSGVQEMKQRVRRKKDDDVNVTRQVFSVIRKAIDEREEEAIAGIREEADKKEKSLEVAIYLTYVLYRLHILHAVPE